MIADAILAQHLLDRQQIAARVAQDLDDDWVVNVGIGMPTLVPAYVAAQRDVILHSENGIVGMGPPPKNPQDVDSDLINAGKEPVTLVTGGAYVHHADSFAIVRGGRLDAAILGAFQVAANGDLANWKLSGRPGGNVGGAMDIAVGAKRVFVMMTHTTREGEPKVVEELTYPLTAKGVVSTIFTDMAVIAVTPEGFTLKETAPGLTAGDVQDATGAPLIVADDLKSISV
jgi:3-oxoadipate CoA-transferase beta subunit